MPSEPSPRGPVVANFDWAAPLDRAERAVMPLVRGVPGLPPLTAVCPLIGT